MTHLAEIVRMKKKDILKDNPKQKIVDGDLEKEYLHVLTNPHGLYNGYTNEYYYKHVLYKQYYGDIPKKAPKNDFLEDKDPVNINVWVSQFKPFCLHPLIRLK